MKIEKLVANVDVLEFINEYVDVEKFLPACKNCDGYEQKWSCPPYTFNPLEYWAHFDTLKIIGYKIYLDDNEKDSWLAKLEEAKDIMASYIYELEMEYPGAVGLHAGSCNLCRDEGGCTRPDGEECKYPERMRYSIESLGGDVVKTSEKLLNTPLKWGRDGEMPEYLVLVGGLLIKRNSYF